MIFISYASNDQRNSALCVAEALEGTQWQSQSGYLVQPLRPEFKPGHAPRQSMPRALYANHSADLGHALWQTALQRAISSSSCIVFLLSDANSSAHEYQIDLSDQHENIHNTTIARLDRSNQPLCLYARHVAARTRDRDNILHADLMTGTITEISHIAAQAGLLADGDIAGSSEATSSTA